jgi:hypothetical protein
LWLDVAVLDCMGSTQCSRDYPFPGHARAGASVKREKWPRGDEERGKRLLKHYKLIHSLKSAFNSASSLSLSGPCS